MRKLYILALALVIGLTGCVQTIPKEALQLDQQSLQRRQLQTRKFSTGKESKLLSASAQVLQDMGFNIDESETKLGVITASKEASAVNTVQASLAILAALGGTNVPIDHKQKIRVSVVTEKKGKATKVRTTFQRVVWKTNGQVSKIEFVDDAEVYQQFFQKLSKSVFLTAHEI